MPGKRSDSRRSISEIAPEFIERNYRKEIAIAKRLRRVEPEKWGTREIESPVTELNGILRAGMQVVIDAQRKAKRKGNLLPKPTT